MVDAEGCRSVAIVCRFSSFDEIVNVECDDLKMNDDNDPASNNECEEDDAAGVVGSNVPSLTPRQSAAQDSRSFLSATADRSELNCFWLGLFLDYWSGIIAGLELYRMLYQNKAGQ